MSIEKISQSFYNVSRISLTLWEVYMKKTFKNKIISFVLALTLILGAMTFAIYAATPTSSDFNEAVDAIKSAATLEARESALEEATDVLDAYKTAGGSESDAEIAEAYEYYVTAKADIEEKVGYCNEFIEAVVAALDETAPYLEIRKNCDIAIALRDEEKIDMSYRSVELHSDWLDELTKGTLSEIEEICDKYIENAKNAAEAKTWKDAKRFVELAETSKGNILDIDYPVGLEDYEGFDDADKNIDKAKAFMKAQAAAAKPFCEAVKNISRAESIPDGIAQAYKILETIDETEENAAIALANLQKAERSYNRTVKYANADADEAANLCFSLLF